MSTADLVIVDNVSTTAEWLLEISGLTVGSKDGATHDIVPQGLALADQVRAAAAGYLTVSTCQGTCAPECPLAGVDGGHAACRLAERLAAQGDRPAEMDADRIVQLYLQAIRAAGTAVFHCRRHAHPAGECWFSDDGSDVCGDVLAVAHRLGA